MIGSIIDFFKGSVSVDIRGADVERFISKSAAGGASLRDIERIGPDTVRARISLDDYFSMRKGARRAMCSMRVSQRRGAPFVMHKLGRRPGLMLGIALIAAAIWVMTGFVWTVEITGCQNVSEREILLLLERHGLKTGARLSSIQPMQIKNSVLMEINSLSFLSINLIGTHAEVIVRERDKIPEIPSIDTPCDVVSGISGVVAALRIKQGTPVAQVGQTIMAGEVIASGTVVSALGDVRLVHAEAEADLRVWRSKTRALPLDMLSPRETGEKTVRRAIIIGDRRINLYMIESQPYAWYYKEVKNTPLTLSEGFRLPVTLVTETYYELETTPVRLDSEKAADIMRGNMRLELESGNAELVSFRFEMREENGAFVARLEAECIETTGVERLIETPAGD